MKLGITWDTIRTLTHSQVRTIAWYEQQHLQYQKKIMSIALQKHLNDEVDRILAEEIEKRKKEQPNV